jgi:hypothetical protein
LHPSSRPVEPMDYFFEDFTESEYRHLLRVASKKWEFVSYTDYAKAGQICLWRHDIDASVHRAHRLAQIEIEEGIRSTFLIHLHNTFYHFFEREIVDLVLSIREMGHAIGLHFDPNYYGEQALAGEGFLHWLQFEKDILEQVVGSEIQVFSYHNPDVGSWLALDQDRVLGMVNAYGRYLRANFTYVSDSNGYWRFKRLKNVLDEEAGKLHILTHPVFWTPEPMSPRLRICRAVEGRAAKELSGYDELLATHGRKNIS